MVIRLTDPVASIFGRPNGILDDVFRSDGIRTSFPAVDIVEHENEYELVAELPGMMRDDVKISVEDRDLTISGERKHYGFPEGTKVVHHETIMEPFARAFELPEGIDARFISAKLEDGILRVHLPKSESNRMRQIKIN